MAPTQNSVSMGLNVCVIIIFPRAISSGTAIKNATDVYLTIYISSFDHGGSTSLSA